MDDLTSIEDALAGLPVEARTTAAALVLIDRVFDALEMDEDDVNAAARRGLLLAAVGGMPVDSCVPGSRAALETAADLIEDGYLTPLIAALGGLARVVPDDCPCVIAAVRDLEADPQLAIESLAVVVLHRALEEE